ncbi:MAG: hypothetical protein VKJ46_06165 [Leptolyngbyaceae bacterium]|nr:hypothetical protein [Leptolyngbyaceae bacterium]
MARYTCLFTVETPSEGLHQSLARTLESCNMDIIYDTGDYMMAREVPGQVSFSKLVTVEILIDKSMPHERETRMNFVIKNEELPLQVDNHCRQVFEQVTEAVTTSDEWHLIERVAG